MLLFALLTKDRHVPSPATGLWCSVEGAGSGLWQRRGPHPRKARRVQPFMCLQLVAIVFVARVTQLGAFAGPGTPVCPCWTLPPQGCCVREPRLSLPGRRRQIPAPGDPKHSCSPACAARLLLVPVSADPWPLSSAGTVAEEKRELLSVGLCRAPAVYGVWCVVSTMTVMRS